MARGLVFDSVTVVHMTRQLLGEGYKYMGIGSYLDNY